MPRHILFDLDGTLIDSADAILAGFAQVLKEEGLSPRYPIERSLIGPPLRSTLARLGGVDDPLRLERMAGRFIDWYDEIGYRGSKVYPGIAQMLAQLRQRGFALHIVTNKRLHPTRLILDWLGWGAWFRRVDTQDLRAADPLASKTEVLSRLLREERIASTDAMFVGDRLDDLRAATDNHVPCLVVAWGYGAGDVLPAGTVPVQSPAALVELLGQP
jgi:phosphoglycolate phosphatase